MNIKNRIKALREIPAGELRANPRNWRTHPQAQRDALAGILAEIGWADALIAYEAKDGTLVLIDGHLRAETAPNTKVPVLVTDLTEAEANKILLTLDPLAAMAGRDDARLQALADAFESKSDALTQMVQDLTCMAGGPDIEDPPIADRPAKPTTKPGDIWTLGRHRLICGDPEHGHVHAQLAGEHKPFMAVTAITQDHASREWARHFKGDVVYLWHPPTMAGTAADHLADGGFEIRAQLVWAQPRQATAGGGYAAQHECCWYAVRTGASGRWRGDRKQSTVWTLAEGPAGRPAECYARPMHNHDQVGGFVCDPFGGGGSTLVAAEQVDRSALVIERDPAACDAMIARWEQFTGSKAKR